MVKKIKDNYKLIIGIFIGLAISITSVYAATTVIKSIDVIYDNSTSGGTSKNVQGSIDELYKKAKELSGEQSTIWKDPILNGADPELDDKLIPVTIDNDGTVHYASLYTKWYNYSEKRWANAVILVKKPSKLYKTGDMISEKDINGYFVWIPRFKYKLWNLGNYTSVTPITSIVDDGLTNDTSARTLFGNARIIDIVFESKTTERTNGTSVGQYLTHPAFRIGSTELNGLWVGKFETGYNQMDITGDPISTDGWTTAKAQVNAVTSSRVIVKPNVYSWRSITVANMFKNAYDYERDLESHMMKNTEWGAAAYLSHSAYGIGNEININNNSSYLTGYSAAANTNQSTYPGTYGTDKTTTQAYNTPTGYLASTTGNITGVYDMAGGAHEYMASYIENNIGSSGLTLNEVTTTYKDYFDVYKSNSNTTTYNNCILGDATGEMGPFINYKDGDGTNRYHNRWYADNSHFVYSSDPWFSRGGNYYAGVLAGQFNFTRYTGGTYSHIASRLVLAIK